jgi:uncharacterized membrane protein
VIEILVLTSFVLSIVAFRRSRASKDLARRLSELERRLSDLQRTTPAKEARAAEPVEEVPPSVVEPEKEATPPGVSETPLAPTVSDVSSGVGEVPPRPPEPPPPPPPPARPAPWAAIDWERWLGVRGAAVLGGIALAAAGVLFFRYSIEHGLISPPLRVTLGTLAGLGAIAGTRFRWRKDYPDAANAICGAGLVILYASFWAARNLYGLIGTGTAFTLMGLVTSAGCLLALREDSLLIAVLGLIGGFTTPFLVASHADNPIGLFGYILILDLALLTVSRRRGWPRLATLSLVGTVLYQVFWIGFRLGPDRLILGLCVLALFAFVLSLGAPRDRSVSDSEWRVTQAGGILVPFAFAIYIASRASLGPHLYPIGLLLFLLSASASWLDRGRQETFLGPGAAAASVAVFEVWISGRSLPPSAAWDAVGVSVALALLFHGFAEEKRHVPSYAGPALAALIAAGGLQVVLIAGSLGAVPVSMWPWAVGALFLTLLLARQGTGAGREVLQPVGWGSLGLSLVLLQLAHGGEPSFPAVPAFFAVLLLAVAVSHGAALVQTRPAARRHAEYGAALLSIVFLLCLPVMLEIRRWPAEVFLGGSLALGFLAALAATRLASGPWYFAAVAATAIAHSAWTASRAASAGPGASTLVELPLQMTAVVLFTAWPIWAGPGFRGERFAWYASALAAPAWFLSLQRLFVLGFGDSFICALPLSLAAISLAALSEARQRFSDADPLRLSVIVWFSAIALGFVSVAIPLQLEKEWITIGWALEVLGLALLWRRLDHPGLKYFAVVLTVAVGLRLLANDAVLGYHARPAWRIANWLAYTYLVPAASLVVAAMTFGRDELLRARDWENPLYRYGFAAAASLMGLAAIGIVFAWINLAIADWFSTGDVVSLSFRRIPAQDLTMSLAWGLYALVLLAVGVARDVSGLRWVSLFILVLTIGKVFLYDLGQLQDLFRVMSLLGLAVSLILVSLAYQRFVFRKISSEEG